MKIRYAVILSMAAGIIVGAVAVQNLRAQAKPPVYFIFENQLTNPKAYAKEYRPLASSSIKAHGGRIIAAGKPKSFAGQPPKGSVGIIVWESMEQLEGWFNSPEYKKARAIGEKYAKYRNFAVPGIAR